MPQPTPNAAREPSADFPSTVQGKSARNAIRLILIAGFGGLIAIIVAGGLYSLKIARQIQSRSSELRADFVSRQRTLEDLRSELFESGNVFRDYILEDTDEKAAASLRSDVENMRSDMDSELNAYSQSLRLADKPVFQKLSGELDTYWSALSPALAWNAAQRKARGEAFLDQEVIPRRANLLDIASEIEQVNEQALQEEEADINATFLKAENTLRLIVVIGSCIGLVLAGVTGWYTLHLENISERRFEQSVLARNELKKLSARLVDAQESERRAISRELHDEVGQSLSSLLMEIDGLAMRPGESTAREPLHKLRNLAQGALNVVRDMSLLLRPSMLDDLGLVPALEWQAREVSRRTGIVARVTEHGVSEGLADEYKTCIYRIVQEALNNASKHAQANKIDIQVRQEPSRILLTIQDNGAGFDPRRVRGMGLMGIAERVDRLDGKFRIESQPGAGTLLRIELPLSAVRLSSGQGVT